MEKVVFQFKNGHQRMVTTRQAQLLTRARAGTYMTRQMTAETPEPFVVPFVETPVEAFVPQEEEAAAEEVTMPDPVEEVAEETPRRRGRPRKVQDEE